MIKPMVLVYIFTKMAADMKVTGSMMFSRVKVKKSGLMEPAMLEIIRME